MLFVSGDNHHWAALNGDHETLSQQVVGEQVNLAESQGGSSRLLLGGHGRGRKGRVRPGRRAGSEVARDHTRLW